jgi:hypothetical protein
MPPICVFNLPSIHHGTFYQHSRDISLFILAKNTHISVRTYGNAVITLSGVCSVIPAHFDARETAFL